MSGETGLRFALDRTSKRPIFEQLCDAIRKRAQTGSLSEGTRLPATRVLAAEMEVSRSTIVTAYDQLVAEGYLQSRPGSGYTVCALGEVELETTSPRTDDSGWADAPPLPRPFAASQPDMRLFPHRQWATTMARICRTRPDSMLSGAPIFGNADLRRAIATHVAEWRGLETSPRQVIVTAGASEALGLCLETLSGRAQTIGLENPGYSAARRFAERHAMRIIDMPIDDEGAIVPEQDPPSMVMLTPSQQYPLGGAMSANRRQAFIRWANTQGSWIIEDDYDSEFRYAGRPIPAMAGFDPRQRTIYIGSFSKVFSTALRLGYVIVPADLVDRFENKMRQTGSRAGLVAQPALAAFMSSGEFYRHLRRMRRVYDERRRFLLDRLQADFSEIGWCRDHQAGMQIVFHLNPPHCDMTIAAHAAKAGLNVEALSTFCNGSVRMNGLILGFCGYTPEEMEPALKQLGSLFSG